MKCVLSVKESNFNKKSLTVKCLFFTNRLSASMLLRETTIIPWLKINFNTPMLITSPIANFFKLHISHLDAIYGVWRFDLSVCQIASNSSPETIISFLSFISFRFCSFYNWLYRYFWTTPPTAENMGIYVQNNKLHWTRVSQKNVLIKNVLIPKVSAVGLNFTMDMTWGRLILLSLGKKQPKKHFPAHWWLSLCTLAPAAFC